MTETGSDQDHDQGKEDNQDHSKDINDRNSLGMIIEVKGEVIMMFPVPDDYQ